MLENIKPERLFAHAFDWFSVHVWSMDIFYQVLIILVSYVLGSVLYGFMRDSVADAVKAAAIPASIRRTLSNLTNLITPTIQLLLMFICALVIETGALGLETGLLIGIMKVITAWIVIKVALQFVSNPMVRNFFAITITIIAALSIFGILDETTAALDAFGVDIGEFRLSALAVIKGLLTIFVLLYFATFISKFAERQVLRSKSLTRSSQVLIAKVIRISLIVFALLVGVTSAGIDLSVLAVISGAIGFGIGFGLQKVVSNLFSGLLLLLDKSITPGDVIELEESQAFGWVRHMGARYTEIITRDNKSYLIPNEDFITQRVVNWSHGDRLIRLEVKFGVHYKSNPHEVIAIAKEAASRPPRVVEEPEPVCWLIEFGDSSLNFTIRFWIKDAEGGVTNVQGDVMLALWDAFKENGIAIPYPHREVYMHEVRKAS